MRKVRLVKVGNSLMAAIPRVIVRHLNLFRGDYLQLSMEGETIHLTPDEKHSVGLAPPELADRRAVRPAEEEDE